MPNRYIEDLVRFYDNSELTDAERFVISAYKVCNGMGLETFVIFNNFHPGIAGSVYNELKKAGVREMFYASEWSNYMESLMDFQKAGARIEGMVEIANPRYKEEIEKFGESTEKEFIPAIKWVL